MKVVAHFDGGCKGNPGPSSAAAVIGTEEGELVAEHSVFLPRATSNEAEYQALLLAARLARLVGADHVRVLGDSKLVVMQVRGLWRVRESRLRSLRSRAVAMLERFDSYTIGHVPRAQNQRADHLCRQVLLPHREKARARS